MTIYDNDLPPGITKDSYLVNPYGSKSEGNMFHDPELNKAFGGGSGAGSTHSGGGAFGGTGSGGFSYGASTGAPMSKGAKAFWLAVVALGLLAYGRHALVVNQLPPYPPTEFVLFSGEHLRINPTAKEVGEAYKSRLALFKSSLSPLFAPTAPWDSFYNGCGMKIRCLSHPSEVVERFRKHAIAPDTFWNDLCNITNYHRSDFPAGLKLDWEVRTKSSGPGILHPTSYSQCVLKDTSQAEVRQHVRASRERALWNGNAFLGGLALIALLGIGAWYRKAKK